MIEIVSLFFFFFEIVSLYVEEKSGQRTELTIL